LPTTNFALTVAELAIQRSNVAAGAVVNAKKNITPVYAREVMGALLISHNKPEFLMGTPLPRKRAYQPLSQFKLTTQYYGRF